MCFNVFFKELLLLPTIKKLGVIREFSNYSVVKIMNGKLMSGISKYFFKENMNDLQRLC